MEERIGNFWHARHSQIYPTLAQLEKQGLVTHEVIEQQERPAKKVYTITEAGLAQLQQWVTQDMEPPAVRDELVLKAYSLWLVDPRKAIALFRTHEQLHLKQLAHYEQLQLWMKKAWEAENYRLDSRWFASSATLQRGIGYEREYAAWCRWIVETLAGKSIPPEL